MKDKPCVLAAFCLLFAHALVAQQTENGITYLLLKSGRTLIIATEHPVSPTSKYTEVAPAYARVAPVESEFPDPNSKPKAKPKRVVKKEVDLKKRGE